MQIEFSGTYHKEGSTVGVSSEGILSKDYANLCKAQATTYTLYVDKSIYEYSTCSLHTTGDSAIHS